MAVRIRMKKLGRRHRPFFRVCAVDSRKARDGRVIEYLGYYDPMVPETDARAVLNGERIDYWLGVGAQPSEKCAVLIKKYGTNGTHLEKQKEARERLEANKPSAPPPVRVKTKAEETPAEETPPEQPAAQETAEPQQETASEPQASAEQASAEQASAGQPEETAAEEAKPEG